MMHLNNSIRYKRSFVNINPQSNTDFTQVTCTVHFYYNAKTFLSFHETSLRYFLVEGTTYSDNNVKKMETHHYQGKK